MYWHPNTSTRLAGCPRRIVRLPVHSAACRREPATTALPRRSRIPDPVSQHKTSARHRLYPSARPGDRHHRQQLAAGSHPYRSQLMLRCNARRQCAGCASWPTHCRTSSGISWTSEMQNAARRSSSEGMSMFRRPRALLARRMDTPPQPQSESSARASIPHAALRPLLIDRATRQHADAVCFLTAFTLSR